MISKDYYRVLDVKPSSSAGDIKRSYRRLAMKYHPDKNAGDAVAASVFTEIAEAYGILGDPVKREAYDYSYKSSLVYKYTPLISVEAILKQAVALQKAVIASSPFHVNKDALYFKLCQLLTTRNIDVLREEGTDKEKEDVTNRIVQSAKFLSFADAKKITGLLVSITPDDNKNHDTVKQFLQEAYKRDQWNRYKPVVAIIVALLLCLLIFLLSK